MKNSAAFFDVDETIINIKSMFDFFAFWCRERKDPDKLDVYMMHFRSEVKNGTPREKINRDYYRQFSGVRYRELEEAGERWFSDKLKSGVFIESAVSALKKHQAGSRRVVFISGSMLPVLSPVAKYLGVKDILCAPLKLTAAGMLTGEIDTPQTIGFGKREALMTFCNEKGIAPADCYAYGDDLSDIPMLEATGHPICVGRSTNLASYATTHRWPII
ncbi:HAD-IB family hydrolase [Erwinia pyri]|uniref:HAD-IB family hydrolase n=1 Tax=Erwinia pyri TaxID=3062598 RepID=A0AA50DL61_9GAMM|nr:HAD-IB family hydrolase [Erwinia sp. DE2]WLS79022.1 HAD-IB family hydrolase [Erwinia sp. DE2]